MTFLDKLSETMSKGRTENGDVTYDNTVSAVLDMFSSISSYRTAGQVKTVTDFERALIEDKTLAMKMLFYLRDVRGGQGERSVFRTLINYLADKHPAILQANMQYIAEYGRWDDLLILFGTKLEADMLKIIRAQLLADKDNEHPSLLAKWLPSENASSKSQRELALKIIAALGFKSPRQYRKLLSHIRAKIRIVETQMSKNEWSEITYSAVPSKAMTNYRDAFKKHDAAGFQLYMDAITRGEAKINASTLYPYELLEKSESKNCWDTGKYYKHNDVLDAQWKALTPKVLNEPAIVLADVSASMNGRPLNVAVSLAMFYAERNQGQFKDTFITFSTQPKLIKMMGSTLAERANYIQKQNWDGSTDLRAALAKILETAITYNVPQDQLPAKLYVISDMQFNMSCRGNKSTYSDMRTLYANHGYKLPAIVFWNVGRHDSKPVFGTENDVSLVSGFSQTLFGQLTTGKTAYDNMIDILNSKRYEVIT